MQKRQVMKAINKTFESSMIRATRRVFFNHLSKPIEERGYFHVDDMYGSGTGILFKIEDKFFLLTADHVIKNATGYNFTNDSPFWIISKSNSIPNKIHDFLMPAWIFHIGDLIREKGKNIDVNDLILVEFFHPTLGYEPDAFINLNSKINPFLKKSNFFEGQILAAAGYPFELNSFQYEMQTGSEYTHSTNVQRYIFNGLCRMSENEPYMSCELFPNTTYPNISGASGGVVTNIKAKSNQVLMAGMLLSAGSKIVRFLPSYLIEYAIKNRNDAKKTLLDPMAAISQSR